MEDEVKRIKVLLAEDTLAVACLIEVMLKGIATRRRVEVDIMRVDNMISANNLIEDFSDDLNLIIADLGLKDGSDSGANVIKTALESLWKGPILGISASIQEYEHAMEKYGVEYLRLKEFCVSIQDIFNLKSNVFLLAKPFERSFFEDIICILLDKQSNMATH